MYRIESNQCHRRNVLIFLQALPPIDAQILQKQLDRVRTKNDLPTAASDLGAVIAPKSRIPKPRHGRRCAAYYIDFKVLFLWLSHIADMVRVMTYF